MAYWICEKCKIYHPADGKNYKFKQECKCGGKLIYYDKISQRNLNESNRNYKIISPVLKSLSNEYESIISRIVLYSIKELPFPVTSKIILLILKGNNTAFIEKHGLNKLETYSILYNYTQNDLLIIIESLLKHEYLKTEYISRYSDKPISKLTDTGMGYLTMIKITPKGEEYLKNNTHASIGFLEQLRIRISDPNINRGE